MNQPSNPTPAPDPDVPVTAEEVKVDPELEELHAQMLQLQAQGQNGANWFYWVAVLSLVNSVIAVVGGGIAFVIGMGVTGIADGFAQQAAIEWPEKALIAKVIAFGFSLVASAVVAGFGWLANKRIIPIFALGMFLYLLDGMIYVLTQQWMCVGFHALALFNMFQGLMAYRKLSTILSSQPAPA